MTAQSLVSVYHHALSGCNVRKLPWLHPIDVGWNLGKMQKIPTGVSVQSAPSQCYSVLLQLYLTPWQAFFLGELSISSGIFVAGVCRRICLWSGPICLCLMSYRSDRRQQVSLNHTTVPSPPAARTDFSLRHALAQHIFDARLASLHFPFFSTYMWCRTPRLITLTLNSTIVSQAPNAGWYIYWRGLEYPVLIPDFTATVMQNLKWLKPKWLVSSADKCHCKRSIRIDSQSESTIPPSLGGGGGDKNK